MKLSRYLIVLLFSLSSCSIFYHTQKPDEEFLRMIKNDCAQTTDLLRYDGMYRLMKYNGSTEEIISACKYHNTEILNPMFFYKNGKILYGKALFGGIYGLDVSNLRYWFSNDRPKNNSKDSWGVYEIKDSTIRAIVYVRFTSSINFTKANWYLCYFEGRIISKEYISDWHMIPPYPKLSRIEKGSIEHLDYMEYEKAPKDFAFKYIPLKTAVDSTKVWISRYKKD